MTRLLIFAKTPVPGRVKTRLIPALGADGACELHVYLLERTLRLSQHAGFAETALWLSEAPQDSQRWHWPHRWRLQQGADLGARMHHALHTTLEQDTGAVVDNSGGPPPDLNTTLEQGTGAVLIGCDVAGLQASDLIEAGMALDSGQDAVLGASEDGGYYLLGLQKPCPALFSDMPWGSNNVAAETLRRLRARYSRVHQLITRWDVDRIEDLARLGDRWRRMALAADTASCQGRSSGAVAERPRDTLSCHGRSGEG